MSNFIEDFIGSFGSEASSQLSSKLGIDQNTAKQIIPAITPLILSGLKKQKDEHGGQDRVDHILNKYGSPNVLNNIGDVFSTHANNDNPDPNLGGLLGNSGTKAANLIGEKFNIDSSTAMKIIPMVAPLILGFLTKKRDTVEAGSSGIASILDQNGDGNILDDVAGFLTKGLGNKRGGLGSLLGGIFGKSN